MPTSHTHKHTHRLVIEKFESPLVVVHLLHFYFKSILAGKNTYQTIFRTFVHAGDCVRIGRQDRPQSSQPLAYIEARDYGNKAQRMQNEIKFDFKTQSDGVIAFAKAPKDSDYFYVGLEGGCLFFEANLGTGQNLFRIVLSVFPRLSLYNGKVDI